VYSLWWAVARLFWPLYHLRRVYVKLTRRNCFCQGKSVSWICESAFGIVDHPRSTILKSDIW